MELVLNEAIYERVVQREVTLAKKWVWILTADVKDMVGTEEYCERCKLRDKCPDPIV